MKRNFIFFIFAIFCTHGTTQAQYGRQNVEYKQNRGPVRGNYQKRLHPCEQSSCYPATGNLLIGRQDRLSVSSTCGLKGPERFCIVSHLKERKKCFFCDATSPKQQHVIENIVSGTRHKTWWQAENGVENVTIQFDLEAEFHFTHIVIKFQTFRPAAMLIERSYDFGKTWQVYRYFAYDCPQSFPGVPTHPPREMTDVICEARYSNVEPSSGGEIIFRVLPANLAIDNPYSKTVQALLKMTNLRIKFMRLHTLGDDLLDDRPEIREKYYYAIRDMVIRGSCSCYGHASRCLPLPGVSDEEDMVHGRCECTHNTKGLNCEFCEDFYNDVPWKPAVGKQTNACRPCNCNKHSDSCHFDEAVFERSGRVSGGVCDNCQHNTMGQNCEQCKPFYYHDPTRDISDPEACQPCDCDPAGSLDDGICDSRTDLLSGDESGRCHCKANVEGRRCDRCKNGFWNYDPDDVEGCQECTCNTQGTIDNQGCNTDTGECTCKRYVTGRDCNQCLPTFWGLSDDHEGCKDCDCDPGGSYDGSCDVVTGQCRCRPHVAGRTCNQPEQSYYTVSLDFLVYEGELAEASDNSQILIREPYRDGRTSNWTGTGFMRVMEGSTLNFTIDDIRRSMSYDIIVRYEPDWGSGFQGYWEDVQIVQIERYDKVDPDGPCRDWRPEDDKLWVNLPPTGRSSVVVPSVCLEEGKTYKVIFQFRKFAGHDSPTASVLIDSIVLRPKIESIDFFQEPGQELRLQEYESNHCREFDNAVELPKDVPEICAKYRNSIGNYIVNGALACECNATGSHSLLCEQYGGSCPCKPNVVGRTCDRCAPGTYGFGPEGCVPCDCDGVGALDNQCDVKTGRCRCRSNTYGRTCGQCEPGFWNFPHCKRCECNGHAESCESGTGACINCRDFTNGHNCELCIDTFYGDPRIGFDIACRACPCPGSQDSGHSYADRCSLDPVTQDVICECYKGYAGLRCESCADNYFGNPETPGGSCTACNCGNNTDLSLSGNCDSRTGHCLQCLFNTDGSSCQVCKPGYFGNALRQDCTECRCDVLGTNMTIGACNHHTGQCPCLPHVVGQLCDECEENHWRIASGEGCEACNCDVVGSVSDRCNPYEGSCECRQGFGGRRCNECQTNYWGNPNVQCFPCECDDVGSAVKQCDRETGRCVCRKGIGGDKCNQCDRSYIGSAPECSPCGECFDNWDLALNELRNKTIRVIDEASRIQKVGTTGVYSQEFNDMEASLDQVQAIIDNTSVKSQDLDELNDLANDLTQNISASSAVLKKVRQDLENVNERVNSVDIQLKTYKDKASELHQSGVDLQTKANKLQEADVQGALNSTLQSFEKSRQAQKIAINDSAAILADSERYRKNTETLLSRQGKSMNETHARNEESLGRLNKKLDAFNEKMPKLNLEMCGANVTDCSNVCGGVGCGFCGGISCDLGAVQKAKQALEIAADQSKKIKKYKEEADQLWRDMSEVKQDAIEARANAQDAFNIASEVRNKSDELIRNSEDVKDRIRLFLREDQTTPGMVLGMAKKVLDMDIHLRPAEIQEIATNISKIVGTLTNPDRILEETAPDLEQARNLEEQAKKVKNASVVGKEFASKLVQLLSETQKTQRAAELAIEKADSDIALSEKDLDDIAIVTQGAQHAANETTNAVEKLEAGLKQLQTQSVRNDFIINQEITVEMTNITAEARITEDKTKELKKEYERARDLLNARADKSKGDINRAKRLLQRAAELTTHTSTKFKELEGMESVYQDNERGLSDLMNEIDALTFWMEGNLTEIEYKAKKYKQC